MVELFKVSYKKYAVAGQPCFVSNGYYTFNYEDAYDWYLRYRSYLETLHILNVIVDYKVQLERLY